MEDRLGGKTLDRVLSRLGLTDSRALDLDSLNTAYGQWCRSIPFDNVRKLLLLHGLRAEGDLPGRTAEDFFTGWLDHGAGGTCWPSSNGLFTLLEALGFSARRISASMYDMGVPNHGSVVVSLPEGDFLADSSLLTGSVLPLQPGRSYNLQDPGFPVQLRPDNDTWVLSFPTGTGDTMKCRLLDDPVSYDFYLERYEITRQESPFNHALYGRRNRRRGRVVFQGSTRIEMFEAGRSVELDARSLKAALIDDLRLSAEICARLAMLPIFGQPPARQRGPDPR